MRFTESSNTNLDWSSRQSWDASCRSTHLEQPPLPPRSASAARGRLGGRRPLTRRPPGSAVPAAAAARGAPAPAAPAASARRTSCSAIARSAPPRGAGPPPPASGTRCGRWNEVEETQFQIIFFAVKKVISAAHIKIIRLFSKSTFKLLYKRGF